MQERVGERLLLVGTAHVSQESVAEVRQAIAEFKPDVVAVELDAGRLEALEDRRRWEETPIHRLLRGDRLWLFLTQVLLASYQRRLGKAYGGEVGAEMLAAIQAARQENRTILLADREIGITMKRAVRRMRFREKFHLTWEILKAMVGGAKEEEPATIEELLKEDVLGQMMMDLGKMAPSVKAVLIDERDAYLTEKIRTPLDEGKRVVAVVGAGHLAGITKRLSDPGSRMDPAALEAVPKKAFSVGKAIGWAVPVLLIALIGYFVWIGLQEGKWDQLRASLLALVLWGGGLAAAGAILARAHVYSIVTAFAVAPITILHPGLAAGWFAGIVEAWVREPVVRDFQALAELETGKQFFSNRVIRVLVVAALTNVGAMIGGFIALGRILAEFPLPGR